MEFGEEFQILKNVQPLRLELILELNFDFVGLGPLVVVSREVEFVVEIVEVVEVVKMEKPIKIEI